MYHVAWVQDARTSTAWESEKKIWRKVYATRAGGSAILTAMLTLIVFPVLGAPITFQGIGVFPNPEYADSMPNGLSADGNWVVGRAQAGLGSGKLHLFRWSKSTGMEDLGPAVGEAVSNDGNVVVGRGDTPPFGAVRWTTGGGIKDLGSLGIFGLTQAEDVSADGSVVVGISASAIGGNEAFKWTEASGMVALPKLGGATVIASANAVSASGSIIVGDSNSQAVLWSGNGAPLPLGFLPGSTTSAALGLSADGSVAVGRSGNEAFLWTNQAGMQGLGFLSPNDVMSTALDVSADGKVVVGEVFGNTFRGEAMIWNPVFGMRSLKAVLEAQVDLSGWELQRASAVSDDGQTITGWGINPKGVTEGWIATIPKNVPEPGTLLLLVAANLVGLLMLQRRPHYSGRFTSNGTFNESGVWAA